MIECTKISELLSAYSDGELDVSEKLIVENHLATCEECSAMYEIYCEISKTISEPEVAVPDALSVGVMNRVHYENTFNRPVVPETNGKQRKRHGFMITRLVPLAACMAVVLLAWHFLGDMWGNDYAAEVPAAETVRLDAVAAPEAADDAWDDDAWDGIALTEEELAAEPRMVAEVADEAPMAMDVDDAEDDMDEIIAFESYTFRAEVLGFGREEFDFESFEILLLVSNTSYIWNMEPGGRHFIVGNEYISILDINGDPISHVDIQPGTIVEVTFVGEILVSDPTIIFATIVQIVE